MDARRFDALTRALARLLPTAGTRRGTLAAVSGGLLGILSLPVAFTPAALAKKKRRRKKRRKKQRRKKRKKKARGPCAPGKSRKNTCKKDRNCCTRFCKKGRCRCRELNQSCTEDANCCPQSTARHCFAGTCQPCDVCASGCPFATIAEAIAAASPGATIRLCAGAYQEPPIHIDRPLTLLGAGQGAAGTILDGRDATSEAVVVVDNDVPAVFLENLRITNGNNGDDFGGGILNVGTLSLTRCTVSDNVCGTASSAGFGGGIFNDFGTLSLTDSTVSGNDATGEGGGIFNNVGGTLDLTNSTVSGNQAGLGGGINNNGSLSLTNSTVSGNDATDGLGGGINNGVEGTVTLDSASHVCENEPDQCEGFTDPACTEICPA